MKKNLIIIIFLSFVLFCGKKGPLTLSEPETLAPVQNLEVKIIGSSLQFEFKIPEKVTSKENIDFSLLQKAIIYSSEKEIDANFFLKFAKKFLTVEATLLKRKENNIILVSAPLKFTDLLNKTLFFGITYYYKKHQSQLSPIISLKITAPPQKPEKVEILQDYDRIRLQWKRVNKDILQQNLNQVSYQIRILKANEWQTLVDNYSFEFFEYQPETEGNYTFQIIARLNRQIFSEPINSPVINFIDKVPPPVPEDFVTFSGKDHILLSWKQKMTADFSHWRIYRKDAPLLPAILIKDNHKETNFRDYNVKPGDFYFYAVSAVDLKGNESKRTEFIKEYFIPEKD